MPKQTSNKKVNKTIFNRKVRHKYDHMKQKYGSTFTRNMNVRKLSKYIL